jgi:RNA 3'-terminal phosphate cyclase (ATP)
MAPPYDFLAETFLPLLERMGPKVTATLKCPGFYPAGGGCFTVDIEPSEHLTPLVLEERGKIRGCHGRAIVANLPESIGHRELKTVHECLNWPWEHLKVEELAEGPGPGNVLLLSVESDALTEVFTGFGEKTVPARKVAARAAGLVRTYLEAGVPVGPYLADQLLVPLAMAGEGAFRTVEPTRHMRTNMEIVKQFLDVDIALEELGKNDWHVALSARAG